jgi:hypothetical protein
MRATLLLVVGLMLLVVGGCGKQPAKSPTKTTAKSTGATADDKSKQDAADKKASGDQAAGKPEELIIGKWEMKRDADGYAEMLEFTTDGRALTSPLVKDPINYENTFKFLDDGTLQFFERGKPTAKFKVTVSANELTTVRESNGEVSEYVRAK